MKLNTKTKTVKKNEIPKIGRIIKFTSVTVFSILFL